MLGDLPVLHRDDRLVAVAKPSGMAVHRGWSDDGAVVALTRAREAAGAFVYPVHRIDRGASGVLVFALDRDAARALHEAFEDGRVTKRYLALVRGIAPEHAVIDHPIPRREGGPRVAALTEVARLAIFERWSLVEARPRTGRLHQVRRHLKHLGHPLIGDVNYGRGEHNRLFRERFGLHRLALHALELRVPHPTTGDELLLRAGLPPDLAGPFAAMGLPVDPA